MLGEVGSDKCEINMRNRKLRIHIVTFSAEISEYNSMDYIILITTRDYNQIWFLFVDFVVRTNGKHTAWMGPAHVLLMKCISSDRQLGRQFLHVFAPSNQRKKNILWALRQSVIFQPNFEGWSHSHATFCGVAPLLATATPHTCAVMLLRWVQLQDRSCKCFPDNEIPAKV